MSDMAEYIIHSPKVKSSPGASPKGYAMVQWLCCKCNTMVWGHEWRGEGFEPRCPVCLNQQLVFNSVYAADERGRITE